MDLARVAIALERYRLAHGEYPESLDALAPQFIAKLPHDIINGQPLHYRRTADGQFVLYSVGWNETDDGGEVGFKKDGSVDINTRRLGLAVSRQKLTAETQSAKIFIRRLRGLRRFQKRILRKSAVSADLIIPALRLCVSAVKFFSLRVFASLW